jgi:hypothetical protein
MFYVETSARDSTNVEKVFVEVARRVPKTAQTTKRADVVPLRAAVVGAGGAGAGGSSGAAAKGACC